MKNKKGVIIICLIVILLITAIVLKIRNDRIAEEKIIEEEKQQVATVLNQVIITKLATRRSGYDINEIQTKMDKEVGDGKVEVYRFEEDIIIKYIETGHEYKVNDYANNPFLK